MNIFSGFNFATALVVCMNAMNDCVFISFSEVQIYNLSFMTGLMKAVLIISAKSPIFHFAFTTPKGSLQAM